MSKLLNILLGKRKLPRIVHGERQILVDVSVLYRRDAGTGIQRVVKALYKLLIEESSGLNVRPVYATRWRGYRLADPAFLTGSKSRSFPSERVSVMNDDIFLGLDLAAHVLPRHRAQIGRWKRKGTYIYLVVYDLLPITRPEWFNRKTSANFHRWFRVLERLADGAICISEHVKKEVGNKINNSRRNRPLDLRVIGLGADIDVPATTTSRNLLYTLRGHENSKIILMVGTLEPRKAYEYALDAFDHVWAEDQSTNLSLVIVGRPGWKTEQLQQRIRGHRRFNSKLFWFDDADDAVLLELYDIAWGLLMASFDEGFGLPVIEAARYGKPIIARDIPVFREVAPQGTAFFPPNASPAELATALIDWAKSGSGTEIDQKDQKYGWHRSLEDLLSIIHSIPKTRA